MKARIKGTDDPFMDIETVEIKGVCGVYFAKDMEFEPTPDHWQDVRERAAIAAMQGMLSNPALVDESLNYRITIEEADFENDEAFAYLTTWIVKCCCRVKEDK